MMKRIHIPVPKTSHPKLEDRQEPVPPGTVRIKPFGGTGSRRSSSLNGKKFGTGFILLFLMLMICTPVLRAAVYGYRMTPGEAADLLDRASEINRALDERIYAVDSQSAITFAARSGSPSSFVHQVKARIKTLAPHFVDQSRKVSGSYNTWFDQVVTNRTVVVHIETFPFWTVTNLLVQMELPDGALDVTPERGSDLLLSDDLGIAACRTLLQALNQVSLTEKVQVNEEDFYFADNFETESIQDINYGSCNVDGCEETVDHIESGQPVTHQACVHSSITPVFNLYSNVARWEISSEVEYEFDKTEHFDSYTCSVSVNSTHDDWDYSVYQTEEYQETYRRRSVSSISLVAKTRPALSGTVKAYSKYNYFVTQSQIFTNTTVHMCAGQASTNKHVYVLPGWNPGLNKGYRVENESIFKNKGVTNAVVDLEVPPDPFDSLEPIVVQLESEVCDTVAGPLGFGLYCYGTIGSIHQTQRCRAVIPQQHLEHQIGPVLMEVSYDYCP